MTADRHSGRGGPPHGILFGDGYLPLFWRLFLPNAAVLGVASTLLHISPPNGRLPAILAGFVVLLTVNLALMRHAFAPLVRLTELARRVDPLHPGERVPLQGPNSEVRALADSFNEMLERLESERRASARRALAVEQEQRRRIARELHDELGQDLTGILLLVGRLERRLSGSLATDAAEIRDQLDGALDAVRHISRQLRPEALDDLGLAPALHGLCERLSQRTGLEIAASIERQLPGISSEGELVIYRVAQESLTNAIRHAHAAHASVELCEADGWVVLRVTDDGCGFEHDASTPGTGIRGMRERSLLINGRLDVRARDGGGTEVELRVPATSA